MADFRRWFTVLAVLAVMAMAAHAQVGVATGSANAELACVANAAGTPVLRPEGFTELVGDILISCTGGPNLAIGSPIPTTNITVYITNGVPITSRYLSSTGASEALLLVDEPGANIPTGASGAYGPNAPQTTCTYQMGGASTPQQCQEYVASVAPNAIGGTLNYAVASNSASGGANGYNVFQGKIGDLGANTVTFYSVPVLPPATSGVSRVFRITNIRVPIANGNFTSGGSVNVFISTSPSQVLPLTQSSLPVGVVGLPTRAGVAQTSTSFQQCTSYGVPTGTALVTFTEGFATAFKTRVVPGGSTNLGTTPANVQWEAEATNTGTGSFPYYQNIPGGLYGGFAVNSESGFIYPSLTGNNVSGNTTYTAGLADFGTRLKAVFYNIPAGLTLYVSTTSTNGPIGGTAAPAVAGGLSTTPFAVLVATSSSSEATSDGFSSSNGLNYTYAAGAGNGSVTGPGGVADNLNTIAITANSAGAATAVWEVTNANPSTIDSLSFRVYVAYAPGVATSTYPYGTPSPFAGQLNQPVSDVQLSLAPTPPSFSITNASQNSNPQPIPRFSGTIIAEGPYVSINLCQTTLLYPFITGASGFDSGIAVANTSMDPFNTPTQQGSCKLYGYGVTVGAASSPAIQTVIPGCDTLQNPLSGTNCFPVVPPGQVMTVLASNVLSGFQGYVIAICNFQYAHGYAALTDLGLRNYFSSYLALELYPTTSGTPGTSPRKGVQGIEALIH